MILAKAHLIRFAMQPDGWVHCIQGGFDVPRGPVGVLAYLIFVPIFWIVPKRWRATYLISTALLVTLMTVGPAFTVTIAALTLASCAIVRFWANPRQYWLAVVVLVAGYGVMLVWPQPPWLPQVAEPLHFYLHWAGLAYLLLRSLHVLNDVTKRRIAPPRLPDLLTFFLFAPSLRMGPIQRFTDFCTQLHGNLAEHRHLGLAALRILSGIVRLLVLAVLMDKFPLASLYNDPWSLPPHRVILGVYLAMPMLFLWISGYIELSIGIGRAMGFVLPENFNYPFLARNINDFWQRWHITLYLWLRDYVFTPLVRRRWHYLWAFVITFTICGAWHGTWYYTLSGVIQGVGLASRRYWAQIWKRQKNQQTTLYRRLAGLGLVDSRLNSFMAWALTFHYEVLCALMAMDALHGGRRIGLRLIEMLTGAALR